MSKYKNIVTTIDNIRFHSKKEANRYRELCLLNKSKIISDLELQPNFKITINNKFICNYKADFAYKQDGEVVYEDVKGFRTQVYKLKKKLTEAQYNVTINEIWNIIFNAQSVNTRNIMKQKTKYLMSFAWSLLPIIKSSAINVIMKDDQMGKVIMFPKQIPFRTEYKSRQATKEVRHIHNDSGELPCDTERNHE